MRQTRQMTTSRLGPVGSTRAGGYTLVELLLAMGLFSLLGVGMVALLSRASDLLTVGASSAETLDSLQTFSEAFGDDVATLYTMPDSETGRPDVRLYSDVVTCKLSDQKDERARIRRLFFVRLIPREGTAPMTRRAGASLEAKGVLDQQNDGAEVADGMLRATGGLMEVVWAAVPEDPQDLATMRLYRGYRSPIGGAGSLLPTRVSTDPGATVDERGPRDAAEIKDVAKPILSGVLHFDVAFWSRKTTTWEHDTPARSGGALHTWDSSRGILGALPTRQKYDGFYFAKDAESLADPTDDTFPRRVRVTLVVEQVGAKSEVGFLSADLDDSAKVVELESTAFVPATGTSTRYVKIGSEWIEFGGVDGTALIGCRRGQRGTEALPHTAGSTVHHGRTVVREYGISTFRDTYADELGSSVGRR